MSFEAPNPKDMIFDPSYFNCLIVHPGNTLQIPENYVDLQDREYPVFRKPEVKNNENFEDYTDSFPPNFQPDQILSNVDPELAKEMASTLHKAGYRLMKGYLGILDMEKSTVADVLSKDIDTSVDRIKTLLNDGALVAPYVQLDISEDSHYYAIGVALWIKS